MENKSKIISLFHDIKSKGFVKSMRKNNTGIGKTFEELIGVVENNLDEPDLLGYEIKSHRESAESYVTLFTRKPSFPLGANQYLLNKYGDRNGETGHLRLHTSMFANHGNNYLSHYSFRLINRHKERKVYIQVTNLQTNEVDMSVGYTYEDIQKCLSQKLRNLFYVEAKTKQEGAIEYFHYQSAEIYENPTLEKFLQMMDEGLIMFDIRMGTYQSGKNIGKPHDHGSGFRIKADNIKQLYATYEKVE